MSKYIYGKNSVMDALNNHFPIKNYLFKIIYPLNKTKF